MKKTDKLVSLVGEFFSAKDIKTINKITNENSGVIVDNDDVIFDFNSLHVRFEGCKNHEDQEELELFYNILDLHLKSLEAINQDDNCLSTVSNHELKNILSSAKLSLEMLSTYDFDKDDRAKLLLQAFNAVSQSVSLFDEMVLMEKLQHQERSKSIDIEMVVLKPIVESILETLSSEISTKAIKTKVEDKSEGHAISASAFWIERALFNLISNAVKYNKEGGTLQIVLNDDKKNLSVSVIDSGIGIISSEQEKVMEKFQTSASTQNQGTGVGLALVKAIAEAHKGKLELESVYEEGTIFTLTLPKKITNNRIEHPLAVMNAAAVLLLVGVSYFFPVIPSFGNIESTSAFDMIKLDNGSTIKIKQGGEYSFLDLHNITGSKSYMRLSLNSGQAEADLHQVHVNFETPTASFRNLGTELNFEQKLDKGVVSVYKGELKAGQKNVYEGEGFVSTASGIQVVELLDPPYGLDKESKANGEMLIVFNPVEGAKKYRLTLAEDEDFTQIIEEKESKSTHVSFTIKKDGYYHIKVAALDKNDILGLPNQGVFTNNYHLQQGITARDQGSYAQAVILLKQSISEFDKHNAEPYSALGWNYYLQNNFVQAARYFKQAIAIRPTEGSKVRLARIYFHLKEYKKADKIYQPMLKDNDNNLDALWGSAEIFIMKHQYVAAKKYLQKLLGINPSYPLANYDMARVAFLMKNKSLGLRYLDKELHYNPAAKELVNDLKSQVKKEAH